MQISLRSQMIAGTTALVGATAIAMTPVAPAMNLPALSTSNAAVSLAAFDNPFTAVLETAVVAGGYLFNGVYSNSALQNWPASGIDNIVNQVLRTDSLGGYIAPGLFPQILGDSFPIVTQLVNNALGYISTTFGAVAISAAAIGDIIWTIPTTAIAVGLDLLTFNFPAVVDDITNAINSTIENISIAGTALLDAGIFVASNVITKAVAVASAVTGLVPLLINSTINQVTAVINSVVNTFGNIVGGLSEANPIEGVWNAAVAGLLGPTGIPGTLVNLTLGAGVQSAPIVYVAPPPSIEDQTRAQIATNFAPSIRTEVQTSVKAIANALAEVPPAPTASVSAAAVRADAAPAAAAAVTAASAPEATAGDSSAAAESTTAAPTASAAADDSTSSDAPKASKAGAARAGR